MSARGELRRRLRRVLARSARALAGAGGAPGLRVLTYHRVNPAHPRDRLSVHPDAFRTQMGLLAASGRRVVPLETAVAALADGAPLGDAVAITFDDGYEDNHRWALPVLEELALPATFFLATRFVGSATTLERYARCCEADGALSWAQAAELAGRGHALGGHGRSHRELAGLGAEELADEVAGCASDIEARTGVRPRLFCYPRGSETPEVRRAVAAAGYRAACTVYPGANLPGCDLMALTRTEVAGGDALADFRLKLEGGFDAWHRLVQRSRLGEGRAAG